MSIKVYPELTKDSNISGLTNLENNFEETISKGDISYFTQYDNTTQKEEWSVVKKQAFLNTLSNRSMYLDQLEHLDNDWISGHSAAPKEVSINLGKSFLKAFSDFIQQSNISLPKLIMGPIPNGGICIELHINEQNAMYATFYDEGEIDIDLKHYDFFTSLNLKKDTYKIIEQYELLTE